ncbi:MAG: aminotransferase [Anaerolineaceae bacterium]|nr:aminotransferase [Anaerolineaceae bacterium]
MKNYFLLDPDVIFLNHGSFGATPRPVFEAYQRWQLRLERQPVHFFIAEIAGHFADARQSLATFLRAGSSDLVFVPNATFGVNIVARSLPLGPGDEVLTTNHEYGACDNVWHFLSRKQGFYYRQQPIPLPLPGDEAIVEHLWQGVTNKTKVIFLSHITSSTAVRFPVQIICQCAREAGILTVVDGAHAPGQIPLDLTQIGADFYMGNCHKWLCAPKGAAFLHAHPAAQHIIEPLVVGWGWGADRQLTYGSDFLDYLQYLGTNDLSAYFAVADAIQFREAHQWEKVQAACRPLLQEAVDGITALTGLPGIYPNSRAFSQMAIVPLPPIADVPALKTRLYADYKVEVPLTVWQERPFIRISVQGYNTQRDIDILIKALTNLLPDFTK